MLYIPLKIQYILNTLNVQGYEAYIVGGCVRDMLLGIEPNDFDVATSASPEQVISLFEKTVPTGIKHGTVTVVLEGEPVEVTTFRCDGGYSDCRRPDSVMFVKSLKSDLARRDFTVNAMAYNEKNGLQDYFGGKDDVDSRILRAVGNPERRFHEDALRILRLFRFSCVLGFSIQTDTMKAAINSAYLLKSISKERIMTELAKAVCGANVAALQPLTDCGGLEFLGLKKSPDYEIILKLNRNPLLAFFSFLYLSDCEIDKTLQELKASNAIKKYCNNMILLLSLKFPQNKTEIKHILNLTAPEIVRDYLTLESAVFNRDIQNQFKMLDVIIKNREPYCISDLNIGGKELTEIGIKGHTIKVTLEQLLEWVVENPQYNKKEFLIKKAIENNS